MTLPPPLADLDPEGQSDHELTRLTVLVGDLAIDVGLPGNVSTSVLMRELIELANDHRSAIGRGDAVFDNADGRWTLTRLDGEPIDPQHCLAQAGVYDGELLLVTRAGTAGSPPLFDDVGAATPRGDPTVRDWLTNNGRNLTCFGVALAAAAALAAVLPRWSGVPAAAAGVLAVGVLGTLAACVLGSRRATASRATWMFTVAMPLLFGGCLYVVPGGFGATSLPMAFALTALAATLVLLISATGRPLHTAVITASAFGGAATTAALLWHPPQRGLGAITATVALIVVYVAPRVTILLSRLPMPRVPTAGEPLDDIDTSGGTTVDGVNAIGKQVVPTEEQMLDQVRRGAQYLTGIVTGAALAAAIGAVLAVDVTNGFYWQGTAFAVAVATVLCLRGRTHHNLLQSATLIGAGLAIAVAVITKTAVLLPQARIGALVALMVLMAVVVACGLVAPQMEFSPVIRRQVEILEYVVIGSVFPLCLWIVRLYAHFRELRI